MTEELRSFSHRFTLLHQRLDLMIRDVPDGELFRPPPGVDSRDCSIGSYTLRSAAIVEQSFGGITTRLWDDPFEWTLPERLSTSGHILEYLAEVEAMTRRGMAFFRSDEDLKKLIPAPEQLRSIFDVLLETVARAEHFQGRAFVIFHIISGKSLPRI